MGQNYRSGNGLIMYQTEEKVYGQRPKRTTHKVKLLSERQWQNVRKKWQADSRIGTEWLAREYKIGNYTISLRKKSEGWVKNEGVVIKVRKSKISIEDFDISKRKPKQEITETKKGRGQPTKYRPEYCQMIVDFFKTAGVSYREAVDPNNPSRVTLVPNRLPTMSRFAASIGVHRYTLELWAYSKDENGQLKNPDFFDSYMESLSYQESAIIDGAIVGAYNSPFAQALLRNFHHFKTEVPERQDSSSTKNDEAELDAVYESILLESKAKQEKISNRYLRLTSEDSSSEIVEAEFRDE